jgi:hypothetical protein
MFFILFIIFTIFLFYYTFFYNDCKPGIPNDEPDVEEYYNIRSSRELMRAVRENAEKRILMAEIERKDKNYYNNSIWAPLDGHFNSESSDNGYYDLDFRYNDVSRAALRKIEKEIVQEINKNSRRTEE